MSNLMSNIYIGLVAEIIKENGKPTLDIRVRIPSLHIGLKNKDLPIAKPIIMPGMFVDPVHFENYFSRVNRVYVIFDSGSKAMPRYFGALGEGASTIIPEESTAGLLPFINLTVDTLPDIAQKETSEAVLFKTNVIYLVRFKNGTMVSEPTLNGINIQLGVTNVSDSVFSAASEAIIPMFYDSTTNTLKLTGSYSTGLAGLADVAYSGSYNDLIDKPDIADMATQTWVANQHYAIEGASYTKEETDVSLASKVDKVEGKGLSTEDFTTALKIKLEAIEKIFVGSAEPDPTENKLWFAIE